jgi:uncharacterized ParB-like nuclease family protein
MARSQSARPVHRDDDGGPRKVALGTRSSSSREKPAAQGGNTAPHSLDATRTVRVCDIVVSPERMRALRPEKVAELAQSIQAQGLLQPVVLRPRGRSSFWLVAGRHRLEAVRELGRERITAVILDGLDADAALLAEIDENLIRADLSPAERAMHVGRRKELYGRAHPETRHGGDRKSAKARSSRQNGDLKQRFTEDAAEKTGKSERAIQRDVERAGKVAVLHDIVRTSLDQGDELDALARLPEAEQRKLAAQAKAGKKVTARNAAKLIRRNEREQELAAATEAASKALGKALFAVIYANPPWRYSNPPMGDVARAVENQYPTMTLEEICALKVPAHEDCVLFLWTPIPQLTQAMEVVRA